jgi:hypothetical protein
MTLFGAAIPRLVSWAPAPSALDTRASDPAPSLADVPLDLFTTCAAARRTRPRAGALALVVHFHGGGSSELNLERKDGCTNQQGGTGQ